MQYTIRNIVTLHRQGKRDYNEDYLFPEEDAVSVNDRLFMVCDGVGGAVRGDQASQLVCQHFSSYMLRFGHEFQTKEALTQALRFTEQKMDEHMARHPESEGMATTLTYLALTEFGAVAAWIGDSRIYHIRGNRILARTKDHSLVNALIAHGEITEAEAKVHPKRNVITRSVSGGREPAKIDVMYIDDIQADDYFLLCSDGILEGVSDQQLLELLSGRYTLSQAREKIDARCVQHSRDNYTMMLIQMGQVLVTDLTGKKEPMGLPIREQAATPPPAPRPKRRPSGGIRRYGKILLIAALLLVLWTWISNRAPREGITHITKGGALIETQGQKILLDALPIANSRQAHASLADIRQKLIEGERPFGAASLFLLTYLPEYDSLGNFLASFLASNEPARLITTLDGKKKALEAAGANGMESGRIKVFNSNKYRSSAYPVTLLSARDTGALIQPEHFVALIHLRENTALYAGSPNLRLELLEGSLDKDKIGLFILNEKLLRREENVRTLKKFPQAAEAMILLPAVPPLSKSERAQIREDFSSRVRFLSEDMERIKFK